MWQTSLWGYTYQLVDITLQVVIIELSQEINHGFITTSLKRKGSESGTAVIG
jgi:hypothetical protein